MILASLLLGAIFLGAVMTFWDNIVDWLQRAIRKVAQIVSQSVYGVKVTIAKVSNKYKEFSRNFTKIGGFRWREDVVTREVSASEVPDDIRARVQGYNETDITNMLELELKGA